jgi:hypothetical protein
MRNGYWRYSTFKKSLTGEDRIAFLAYTSFTKTDCKRIVDEAWYQDYIIRFNIPTDFQYIKSSWANHIGVDYRLLLMLIFSSHCSYYEFVLPCFMEAKDLSEATIPDVEIKVKSEEDGEIRKERVSKLLSTQIYNLFNIYVNEQIGLFLKCKQIFSDRDAFPEEVRKIELAKKERLETFHYAVEEISCKILRNRILFIALHNY